MTRKLEAVFEQGVLRPLKPLPLAENQHVLVTITDLPVKEQVLTRKAEQEWLNNHGSEFRGQWVALEGETLLSHGWEARTVRDEARKKGVANPLMVQIPEELELPSAGWL